jgi:very-short-patch-repair endonuclease
MFGALSGKHLKNHNITAEQYREQFPGHQTREEKPVSVETRARMSASRTGKKHSPQAKAKIGAKHKGKKRTAQEIDKWRISYSKFLQENGGSPQKGYKRSDEFKARMSEVALNRPPELVQQKIEQMWEARRGSKATPKQRENYSAGRIKFMIENPDKLGRKLFNTVPELEFEKELVARNITFSKSVHIGNRVFDFKIGSNILIEIDGPYHRRLGMYIRTDASDDDKISKLLHTIERDRHKDRMARDAGYLVYRMPVGQHLPADWYQILEDQGFTEF